MGTEPDYTDTCPGGYTGGHLWEMGPERYWPKGVAARKITLRVQQFALSERHHVFLDAEVEYNYIWNRRPYGYGKNPAEPIGWTVPWAEWERPEWLSDEGRIYGFHSAKTTFRECRNEFLAWLDELRQRPDCQNLAFQGQDFSVWEDHESALADLLMHIRTWGGYITEGA